MKIAYIMSDMFAKITLLLLVCTLTVFLLVWDALSGQPNRSRIGIAEPTKDSSPTIIQKYELENCKTTEEFREKYISFHSMRQRTDNPLFSDMHEVGSYRTIILTEKPACVFRKKLQAVGVQFDEAEIHLFEASQHLKIRKDDPLLIMFTINSKKGGLPPRSLSE